VAAAALAQQRASLPAGGARDGALTGATEAAAAGDPWSSLRGWGR